MNATFHHLRGEIDISEARQAPIRLAKTKSGKPLVAGRLRMRELVEVEGKREYVDRFIDFTCTHQEWIEKAIEAGRLGPMAEVELEGRVRFVHEPVKTDSGTFSESIPRLHATGLRVLRFAPQAELERAKEQVERQARFTKSTGVAAPQPEPKGGAVFGGKPFGRLKFSLNGEVPAPPKKHRDRPVIEVRQAGENRQYLFGRLKVSQRDAQGEYVDHYVPFTAPASPKIVEMVQSGALGTMAELDLQGQLRFDEAVAVNEERSVEYKVLRPFFAAQSLDVVRQSPAFELERANARVKALDAYQAKVAASQNAPQAQQEAPAEQRQAAPEAPANEAAQAQQPQGSDLYDDEEFDIPF